MILGIGIDMVEIDRVEKACMSQAFSVRVYTPAELDACGGRYESLAGRFAVKEAVVKAFGTGFRGISPRDIETLQDELGKPVVKLGKAAEERFLEMGGRAIHVSITHTKTTATAMVILED